MEHVKGRVFWDQALPQVSNDSRSKIYGEMNRTMAALHGVNIESVGAANFGKHGSYVRRQIERWSRQYRVTETERIPSMDHLLDWLPANLPAQDETAIVHGDFRLDNLIFHPEQPKLLAVLDWELSTLGHPIADFAYHCMSWHLPQRPFSGIKGLDLQALSIPGEFDYLRQYCERTGRNFGDVAADWHFYIVFNLFKSASIAQGITRRAMDGVASHSDALNIGRRVFPFSAAAWELARCIEEKKTCIPQY
jgi:aminoglycoside phosphotransferase (APT) family kinase protein